MQFILEGWEAAAAAVAERLVKELSQGKHVLWLVSGGSNVMPGVEIMKKISEDLSRSLTIMPADERFGPVGHEESNWTKLLAAGFDAKQAVLLPVLVNGLDFETTAKHYDKIAAKALSENSVVVGQLGLGADGHTAGILPDSPAAQESDAMVAYYDAPPLKRLTLTFPALKKITAAYVLAFGADKKPALENLKQNLPLNQQPAQILKDIAETYIYNDQLGEAHA